MPYIDKEPELLEEYSGQNIYIIENSAVGQCVSFRPPPKFRVSERTTDITIEARSSHHGLNMARRVAVMLATDGK